MGNADDGIHAFICITKFCIEVKQVWGSFWVA